MALELGTTTINGLYVGADAATKLYLGSTEVWSAEQQLAYEAEVLLDSPLGLWMLDDASGTTMTDSSGNARNGTYVGTPSLAQTSIIPTTADTCVALNGTSQYGSVADAAWMDVTSITVGAVVRITSTGAERAIMSREGSSPSSSRSWSLRFSSTAGGLQFYAFNAAGSAFSVPHYPIVGGNVYHVVGRYDAGATAKMYVNGVETGSVAVTGNLRASTFATEIGRALTQYWVGQLQGAYVIGSAIDPTRILAHATAAGLV